MTVMCKPEVNKQWYTVGETLKYYLQFSAVSDIMDSQVTSTARTVCNLASQLYLLNIPSKKEYCWS